MKHRKPEKKDTISELSLKGLQLDASTDKLERELRARSLIADIKQESESYETISKIKYCSLYLDLQYVREQLVEIYNKSNDNKVKDAIKKLYHGELDTSLVDDIKEFFDYAKQEEEKIIKKRLAYQAKQIIESKGSQSDLIKLKQQQAPQVS